MSKYAIANAFQNLEKKDLFVVKESRVYDSFSEARKEFGDLEALSCAGKIPYHWSLCMVETAYKKNDPNVYCEVIWCITPSKNKTVLARRENDSKTYQMRVSGI